MNKYASPGPLAPIDDLDAMLYLGHLIAQAEIALPDFPREAQIALTWLSAHVAKEEVRLWTAKLEDIAVGETPIGSWKLVVRTAHETPERITIERRSTLRQNGIEIAALAHPFLESTERTEAAINDALESILDFSVMTLASAAKGKKLVIEIRDVNGTHLSLSLAKIPKVKLNM